jgi:hypothetical protein
MVAAPGREINFSRAFDDLLSGDVERFSKAMSRLPPDCYVGMMFGLLGLLVREKFGVDPLLSALNSYAKQIHDLWHLDKDSPPRWVVESVLRGGAGEVGLLGQVQSKELFESIGLVIREILADLDLKEGANLALKAEAIEIAERSTSSLVVRERNDAAGDTPNPDHSRLR